MRSFQQVPQLMRHCISKQTGNISVQLAGDLIQFVLEHIAVSAGPFCILHRQPQHVFAAHRGPLLQDCQYEMCRIGGLDTFLNTCGTIQPDHMYTRTLQNLLGLFLAFHKGRCSKPRPVKQSDSNIRIFSLDLGLYYCPSQRQECRQNSRSSVHLPNLRFERWYLNELWVTPG